MSTPSSSLSSLQLLMGNSQPESNVSTTSRQPLHLNQLQKSPYKAAHQVKLLHLEVEIESLLLQLKTLKEQRLATEREVVHSE